MFCHIDILFDAKIWMDVIKMYEKSSISKTMLPSKFGVYETTSIIRETIGFEELIFLVCFVKKISRKSIRNLI